ncbi:MAG: hypothetical protein H7Y61_15230, partial [Rhizobiales bacterium]|nr:hypothetical protein [Rhizobacter sp.]
MPHLTRRLAGAAIGGLVVVAALLGVAATAGPVASDTPPGAPLEGCTLYAHKGLPEWAEAGYRS